MILSIVDEIAAGSRSLYLGDLTLRSAQCDVPVSLQTGTRSSCRGWSNVLGAVPEFNVVALQRCCKLHRRDPEFCARDRDYRSGRCRARRAENSATVNSENRSTHLVFFARVKIANCARGDARDL